MNTVTVVAVEKGFDNLCMRMPGDKFQMPENVFKVHEENYTKAMKRHEKLLNDGKESQAPEMKTLWFRKANKEEVDTSSDLV